jgi:hypothetical protein
MTRSSACVAAWRVRHAGTSGAPIVSTAGTSGQSSPPLNFTRTPITWARAQDIVSTRTFTRFSPPGGGRSETVQSLYDMWRDDTLERYASVADFINIERLGFPRDPASGTSTLIRAAPLPDPPPRKIVWWINDFPYFLEDGVEHHVVWLSGFGDAPSLELHPAIVAEIRANRPPELYGLHPCWPAGNASIVSRTLASLFSSDGDCMKCGASVCQLRVP